MALDWIQVLKRRSAQVDHSRSLQTILYLNWINEVERILAEVDYGLRMAKSGKTLIIQRKPWQGFACQSLLKLNTNNKTQISKRRPWPSTEWKW